MTPIRQFRSHLARWSTLCSAVAVLALSGATRADARPQWHALDGAPAGTPPRIQMDPGSTTQQTRLQVTIHGFWYETIQQQGQTFTRMSLERDGTSARYGQVGRPELPALHHLLGALAGTQMDNPQVQPIEEVPLSNVLIWPRQPEILDHDGDPPPPFQWDQAFYQQTTSPYPAGRGAGLGLQGSLMGLRLIEAETYPFRYVPATRMLMITKKFHVTINHPGSENPADRYVTRRGAALFERTIENWGVVHSFWDDFVVMLASDFLIITDPDYEDEIEPLAEQKRERGYTVTVVTTDVTGTTCDAIRDYIIDWYNDGAAWRDRFVLLNGETDVIPTCDDENGNPTDDLYACIEGVDGDGTNDPYPEIYLGRLSPDSEAECTDMVEKILEYEDALGFFGAQWVDDALLVAHKEDYPDKYTEAHETVRTAWYSNPPVFHTAYGGEGATDTDVIDAINDGMGLVAYRGHGSSSAWTSWNLAGESFNATDVALLANGTKTPPVFGIACTNNSIDTADCIGETWMETTQRAVSYYGATVASYTTPNHTLDRELFEAIYDDDLTMIGQAIAAAEAGMIADHSLGEYNAWIYLLLGDPEMKIWTEAPLEIVINYPREVHIEDPVLPVRVLDRETGLPMQWCVVAVYKDGEFQANRYTDGNGACQIPLDLQHPGSMSVTAFTEFDSHGVAKGVVNVLGPADVISEAAGAALRLDPVSPNPSVGAAVVRYTLPVRGSVDMTVVDAAGRRVATLESGVRDAGPHRVEWNGAMADGRKAPGGLYFARLDYAGESLTTKILLAR